jgi:putative membrane protein
MKMPSIWIILMLACAALMPSLAISAEKREAAKESSKASKALSASDREFVTKAASDGAAEVELGKLASKKGETNAVRRFGERMVKDHSKAGAELKKIASAKGMTVSDKPGPEHAAHKAKLQKLTGAEFDREYMELMREDHEKAVDLFKKQADKGDDADLKKFAAKTLPTLEAHRKMAEAKPEKAASKSKM